MLNSSFHIILFLSYYYMGDYMFEVGDLVTRKSYDNDIVFKIINVENSNYILMGVSIRLIADAPKDDLKHYSNIESDDFSPELEEYRSLERDSYFYLPGKIVHVDMDEIFLERCMKFYKKNKLKAYGILSSEHNLTNDVIVNLKKYNPDILVITGHDSFNRSRKKEGKYKNTSNFIEAVKAARKFDDAHDDLIIIAGACQSNYEELIKAGANFASSPKRINIHALDPAIVAACIAFSDRNSNIDLIKILNKTKYGSDGIGGIITKGTMYIGYPR